MPKPQSKSSKVEPHEELRPVNRRTPWVVSHRGYIVRPGDNFRIKELKDWDSNCLYLTSPIFVTHPGMMEMVREEVVARMKRLARLLKVQILTYCMMPEELHLLVRVPERKRLIAPFRGHEGEAALIEHVTAHDSKHKVAFLKQRLASLRANGRKAEAQDLLRRYQQRIGSVSAFMKDLKFKVKRNTRYWIQDEPQWGKRYSSWLVEDRHPQATQEEDSGGSRTALRLVAVNLELMPLRAGLVEQPGEFRWTGWAAALRGDGAAIAGICDLVGCSVSEWETQAKPIYAGWLRGDPASMEPLHERVARAVNVLTVPGAIGFPQFVREMQTNWLRRFGKPKGVHQPGVTQAGERHLSEA